MDQPQPFDPDPDDQLGPWSADDLEDDPEELGTPVYEGTGLSVRALTAEEVDRFLEANAGQPAQLLGANWDRLQPTEAPWKSFPDPPRPGHARLAGLPARRAAPGPSRRVRQPRPLRPPAVSA